MQHVVEGHMNSMRRNGSFSLEREKEKRREFYCVRRLNWGRKLRQEKEVESITKGWRIWNNKRMSSEGWKERFGGVDC